MSFIEIVEENESFRLEKGESWFDLRRFDTEVYRQIEKRHTTKRKNIRGGGWIVEVDEYAVNQDLLDYMITGWGNVKSPTTKKDVECTRENKLKLPGATKVEIIEACDADHITTGKDPGEKKTTG